MAVAYIELVADRIIRIPFTSFHLGFGRHERQQTLIPTDGKTIVEFRGAFVEMFGTGRYTITENGEVVSQGDISDPQYAYLRSECDLPNGRQSFHSFTFVPDQT